MLFYGFHILSWIYICFASDSKKPDVLEAEVK